MKKILESYLIDSADNS